MGLKSRRGRELKGESICRQLYLPVPCRSKEGIGGGGFKILLIVRCFTEGTVEYIHLSRSTTV